MAELFDLASHPKRAFKVQTTIFREHTRDTSVHLARGERLFVITDECLSEAPHCGPDNILIITEHFRCWPVVAIRVHEAHADRWRSITDDDRARMMKRVRANIAAFVPTPTDKGPHHG